MNPRLLTSHPLAELMPAMAEDEFLALVADIKQHGVREPVVIFENMILDGRHRLKACDLLGVDPQTPREFTGTEEEARAFVISANLHRRNLKGEQKRELIATLVRATPEKSDRQIAQTVGASPTTVGDVRAQAEAAGDVSKLDTRKDSKGREQPAKKPERGSRTASGARRSKPVAPSQVPKRVVTARELADDYRARINHDYLELAHAQKQEFVRRLAAIINLLRPEAETSRPAADVTNGGSAEYISEIMPASLGGLQ
jgi:ParB-like chromosome segregation protein Spo0J